MEDAGQGRENGHADGGRAAGTPQGGEESQKIGAVLERRRLEKGLTLRDVEQATKIRTRYLEGLEREDYTALPDAVYVHGFLKTYANFLGLDGDRLSRELKDRRTPRRAGRQAGYESTETTPAGAGPGGGAGTNNTVSGTGLGGGASGSRPPGAAPSLRGVGRRRGLPPSTVLAVALALLALAAVVGALYYVGVRSASRTAEEAPPGGPVAEQPDPPSQEGVEGQGEGAVTGEVTREGTAADGSAPPGAVRATVRAVGSSVGMTIRTDGTVAYDGVAQPGFSQTFEGRQTVQVAAANGGAVEVEANGQNVGRLASSGQPVTRDFTPDSP